MRIKILFFSALLTTSTLFSKETIFFEAESGIVSGPMKTAYDAKASADLYVFSSSSNIGGVDLFFTARSSAAFVLWARTLSVNAATDSFFVALDTSTEDVFNTVISPDWKWNKINKTYNLNQGLHSIRFRSREAGTKLDQAVFTSDLNLTTTTLNALTVFHPCPLNQSGSNQCLETIIQYQIKPIYESKTLTDIQKCDQIRDIMIRKIDPLLANDMSDFNNRLRIECATCTIRIIDSGCPWAVISSTP
jgi:hypothetical protein